MKKKWLDLIFIVVFMAMLFVPLLLLDTTPDLVSEQENRAMTKWPGLGFNKEINEWYGHYVEDRVGFREAAVRAYTKLTYGVFGEFSEKLHMFGKEGYVFPADDGYVQAYQRLRTDERLISDFTTYLENTKEYLDGKGIPFVFVAGLDKKTVYPEYMPDSIRVKEDNESIMESLARHLEEANVPYVIPIAEYQEAKKTQQIYNKKYDCAHWNDLGKMIAVKLVDEKLREQGLDVPVIKEEDYYLGYEVRNQLEFVPISIDEQVPVYQLKESLELWEDYYLTSNMHRIEGTSAQFYGNVNAKTKKKLLVFHDSFLQDSKEYYCARYSQVVFVSRQNYENLQYYVNLIQPDAVVFENAERAFVDDLYAYINLAAVKYQPAYESFGELGKASENQENAVKQSDFSVEITEAEGATANSNQVVTDSNVSYCVLKGRVQLPDYLAENGKNLQLYAKYKKKYYEISFPAIRTECPGIYGENSVVDSQYAEFYIAFRRSSKAKGKMKLVLVDKEQKIEYQVGTLHIS
ncbi:MAG: hypothetical protein IIV45_18010 [Lachnospiraceae bacterium]|nr:hypothetical protein [Lachnospiraceae bacterium]